jgi:hypothetical protein
MGLMDEAAAEAADATSTAQQIDRACLAGITRIDVAHRGDEMNGIRIHLGEPGRGSLVILCHDFLESRYSRGAISCGRCSFARRSSTGRGRGRSFLLMKAPRTMPSAPPNHVPTMTACSAPRASAIPAKSKCLRARRTVETCCSVPKSELSIGR